MSILLRGLLIGLMFGIPVGAVGALTVQRTLTRGVGAGILTGFGSSIADCIYAIIGALGLTIVSDFLIRYQSQISYVSVFLLVFIGVLMLVGRTDVKQTKVDNAKCRTKIFLSSFCIAITNPATILTFLLAFSYFGLNEVMGVASGCLLVAGVLVGTMIWWISISVVTNAFRNRVTNKSMAVLNIIFGVVLILFAIFILVKTLFL